MDIGPESNPQANQTLALYENYRHQVDKLGSR
jgi:hypothetical protein